MTSQIDHNCATNTLNWSTIQRHVFMAIALPFSLSNMQSYSPVIVLCGRVAALWSSC